MRRNTWNDDGLLVRTGCDGASTLRCGYWGGYCHVVIFEIVSPYHGVFGSSGYYDILAAKEGWDGIGSFRDRGLWCVRVW